MSLETEIGTYLQSAGLGLTLGTNLFAMMLEDSPDAAVAVYGDGGLPQFTMSNSEQVRMERLQIIIRDTTVPLAKSKATAVYNAMKLIADTTLSGVLYQTADPIDIPTMIQRDAKDRVLYAINYECWKTPS